MRWGTIRGLWLLAALLVAPPVAAQETAPAEEVLLLADEVTYDRELGVVTARGNVEISRGERIVHADTVSYNQKSGVVSATGNVSLTDEDGNTVFADYAELTKDFRTAAVASLGLLLSDQSRLAAASAERSDGNLNVLNRAVYSPCKLCAEDPTRPPLWQIKAVRVVYDQGKHRITYRDAWMEIFGVPVIYTPYFSHPDPTVKRETGLLTPRFGFSDKLGVYTQLPLFVVIDPDKDLTLAPIVSIGEYPVLFGEYRQRFVDGALRIAASGTLSDEDDSDAGLSEGEFRGHIDATGRFDVDENWRWGFDIQRATDKTYERLFDFSDERNLTTRAFAEMFDGRNYASFQGSVAQGTRDSDENDEAPIVAPLVDYNFVSEPVWSGSYFTFDADAMVLSRIEGRDSRRLSVAGGWRLPYTSSWGDVTTFSASVRADLYSFNDVLPGSNDSNPAGPTKDGVEVRFFPQAAVDWRYPWARDHDGWQEVIEPVVSFVAAPNNSNDDDIPNEDSLDIEYDDTNLFDANRFTGLDVLDTGQRVNYGLRWSFLGDDGGYASAFVGQSYQINDNLLFGAGSGLDQNFSDIVGSVQLSPHEYFDMLYRFRFDADSLTAQRNELLLQAGPPVLNLGLSYAFLSEESDPGTTFGDREEIFAKLSSQFTENWSGFIAGREDIESNRVLSYGFGLRYQDECFDIRTSVAREQYRDEELDPNWKVLFSVAFKNLGTLGAE